MVFDHLISPQYDDLAAMTAQDLLGAQMATSDFLDDDTPLTPRDASLARQSFASLLTADAETAKQAALNLKTPAAVQHTVAMLSAYDWDFVEQAKQIRGYVVAKITDETTHPDARIRLRALELLGKVTEVAAFTERSEVVHKSASSEELDNRLRERLKKLLPPTREIETIDALPVKEIRHGNEKASVQAL